MVQDGPGGGAVVPPGARVEVLFQEGSFERWYLGSVVEVKPKGRPAPSAPPFHPPSPLIAFSGGSESWLQAPGGSPQLRPHRRASQQRH